MGTAATKKCLSTNEIHRTSDNRLIVGGVPSLAKITINHKNERKGVEDIRPLLTSILRELEIL